MKTFKFLSIAVAILFFSAQVIANDLPKSAKPELSQIKSMIQKINFEGVINQSTTVKVRFMVNTDSEIVIISTDNIDLDSILKHNLSYQKIKVSDLRYNEVYTLPITIQ